jgi:hypothetical protein
MPVRALAESSGGETMAGICRNAGRMGERDGLVGRWGTAVGRVDSHPSGSRRNGFDWVQTRFWPACPDLRAGGPYRSDWD